MTDASATRLSAIGQIAMVAKDVPRATAFYRDRLGMKFLFEFPGLAFFDCDGVRLMISRAEKPEFDHPGSVLYFKVGDIASAHADLEARGVEFVDAPHLIARLPDHELWMAFFRDSEGNTLALMEERR
jgi:catechol 2,3-dioxygenase-like lactoylglutathione lyase family enzyme